jgi:hypothetical protein
MIAGPQITTRWELGLFMLAPVSLAILAGILLRWRDKRLERLSLQDVSSPKAEHLPEQRRAKRVAAAIPVLLYGRLGDEPFNENAETINVCEYGGLVTVSADLTGSQALILTNAQTNQDVACRVARLVRIERGQILAGLEFLRHSPHFWDRPKTMDNCVSPD